MHGGRQGARPGAHRRLPEVPSFGAAVILTTVLLGASGAARAENECGPLVAGVPVECSPSNYDAATDGDIVYRLTNGRGGNVAFRFVEGLTITYDYKRENLNDELFFPGEPGPESLGGLPLYSAVRIETDKDYEGDISLFSSANLISSNGRGISVAHNGTSGSLRTDVSGGSFKINSDWSLPHAIHSYRGDGYGTDQELSGKHDLVVHNVSIDMEAIAGEEGWDEWDWNGGIVGTQDADGDLNVDVQDSTIKGKGRWVAGIGSAHYGTGNMDVDVRGVQIDVEGEDGLTDGIYGLHLGNGDTNINVRDADITVRGNQYSNGISYGYWRKENSKGNLSLNVQDVVIKVEGERNIDGIFGMHRDTGDIKVNVERAKIDVITKAADSGDSGDSGGIAFVHDGEGRIDITAGDVKINVEGDRSVGIGAGQRYDGTGDIAFKVHGSSTIAVSGEKTAGIRSFNFSGKGSIDIEVDEGTMITAKGAGSSGILVGRTGRKVRSRTEPIKAPARVPLKPVDGSAGASTDYDPQTVVVNGHVWGGGPGGEPDGEEGPEVVGAGVRLYGGGAVEIGRRGSVGADSGVAVRAEGKDARLRVAVALGGRRPDEVIKGSIQNNEGSTTIQVDEMVLHDDAMGVTGARAPDGARDVTLEISETASQRSFHFVRPYAPRAAVYEVLPGFMQRLDHRGQAAGKRLHIPDSPVWITFTGGQGSYEPDDSYEPGHSHVGGTYDFNRFNAEVGLDFALSRDKGITGWTSLRHVKGKAQVSAPTGGGEIGAAGYGVSAGVIMENTAGYYANGSASLTSYGADLRTNERWDGDLKDDVGATVRTFAVEAGRHFLLADNVSVTPRAWLTHGNVLMDSFEDAVGSEVSLKKSSRSVAGLGVVAETRYAWDGGERTLDLRGWVGVEQVLGDGETVVDVSGERLGSEATRAWAALGLGAVHHWKRWSLGVEASSSALGSDNSNYSASLSLGTQF